jgi:hypothetical protein
MIRLKVILEDKKNLDPHQLLGGGKENLPIRLHLLTNAPCPEEALEP